MQSTPPRRELLAAAAAVAVAGCSARDLRSDVETDREERTVPVGDAGRFELANDVGEVTVRGGDRDDVRVVITRRGPPGGVDGLRVRTVREGGTLRLVGELPDVGDVERRSIDLAVDVPASLPVRRVRCAVGATAIRGTTGDLRVDSDVGAVDVTDVGGFVDLRGGVDRVTVDGVAGVDRVTTGAGSVDVGVPAVRRDARIETGTGSVTAVVARDIDARVEAETGTGELTVEGLPLSVTRSTPGATATGSLGGDRHTLTVETTVGEITLRRL